MLGRYQPSELLDLLTSLGLDFIAHTHEPVFNCHQAQQLAIAENQGKTKNLFVHNRKKTQYYLIVVSPENTVDLKALANSIKETKLSFAPEEDLLNLLGIGPGCVSLLALVNDQNLVVKPIIDSHLWSANSMQCHPLRNDMTLEIPLINLENFLNHILHTPLICEVPKKV